MKNDTAFPHAIPHPYYPPSANIVGYLANTYSVPYLLGSFAAGCVVTLGSTWMLVSKLGSPHLRATDKWTALWFVLCGCIHLFFEGYYSWNYREMAGLHTVFGQMWKEYAKSDSRYLTQDAFVLCMETVTAFLWGPLSYITAYLISVDHPLRHPLQMIVSLGQLYGDVLYYATSLFDKFFYARAYSRPEAYYFWGYYVGLNTFWIVIPGLLLYSSSKKIAKAFRAAEDAEHYLRKSARALEREDANGAARAAEKTTAALAARH